MLLQFLKPHLRSFKSINSWRYQKTGSQLPSLPLGHVFPSTSSHQAIEQIQVGDIYIYKYLSVLSVSHKTMSSAQYCGRRKDRTISRASLRIRTRLSQRQNQALSPSDAHFTDEKLGYVTLLYLEKHRFVHYSL